MDAYALQVLSYTGWIICSLAADLMTDQAGKKLVTLQTAPSALYMTLIKHWSGVTL